MRRALVSLTALAGLFIALPARAHFHLEAPKDWLNTTETGDPQKSDPCGLDSGAQSGVRTKVTAGSKLTLMWTETVGHPGHYRISFTKDRSQLVDPTPVLSDNGTNCDSLAINPDPKPPLLLDGLYPHAAPAEGMQYTQEITIPNEPCEECTLQLIEFMSSHAPTCFYHHCARLKIVAESLASPLEEAVGPLVITAADGGVISNNTITPPSTTPAPAGSNKSPSRLVSPSDDGGCSVGGNTAAPLGLMGLVALALVRIHRRAR